MGDIIGFVSFFILIYFTLKILRAIVLGLLTVIIWLLEILSTPVFVKKTV